MYSNPLNSTKISVEPFNPGLIIWVWFYRVMEKFALNQDWGTLSKGWPKNFLLSFIKVSTIQGHNFQTQECNNLSSETVQKIKRIIETCLKKCLKIAKKSNLTQCNIQWFFYAAHVILLLWARIPSFTVESIFRHLGLDSGSGFDSRSERESNTEQESRLNPRSW